MIKKRLIILFSLCIYLFIFSFPAFGEDGKTLLERGDTYYKENRLSLAEENYNIALNIYLTENNREGINLCYLKLGDVSFALTLYDTSLDYYEKSRLISEETGNKNLQGKALIKSGEVHLIKGSYEKSLGSYLAALKIYEEAGDKEGLGDSYEQGGDVYRELGLYEEALDYYGKALSNFIELNNSGKIALTLCKMGEVYFVSGDKNFGLEKLQEALNIAKKDSSVSYDVLMRTAEICHDYENYDISLAMYDEARKGAKEKSEKKNEIKAMLGMADIYLLKGDDETALGVYEKIGKIAEEAGDKGIRIDALFKSAVIYKNHFRTEDALKNYGECLKFYETVGNRWKIIETEQEMAKIYEETGQKELAAKFYKDSIEDLEEIRGEIKIEEFKESFAEKVMPMYKRVINFFLKHGMYEDGLNYFEMARARALLDAITGARVDIKKGADPALLEKIKELQAQINHFQTELARENSLDLPDREYIAELESGLDKAGKEFRSVKQQLVLSSPSYAFLTGLKKPLTLTEIQNKVLTEKSFILEYFINHDRINVWVISKSSFSMVEIPVGEKEIEEKIELFRKPFEELKKDTGRFNEILAGFDTGLLENLYGILIKPVTEKVNIPANSELIIVPDGILYNLPFELLVTGIKSGEPGENIKFIEFSGKKYLIEDYNISYSPSASALDPELFKKEKESSGLFLGFANPGFAISGTEDTFETDILKSFVRLQGSESYYLPPLPDTETQVKNIGALFKDKGKTEIYLQNEATEENVKNRSSEYKYLLFATHGLLNKKNPMNSSLVFTLGKSSGEDGFLQAMEILNMELSADLVVLSACETGLGEIKRGEGVIGLTRAFMYAGSPSVVVSLWSVESGSTAKFMEIFYGNLNSGMTKGEALRQAKISFMKETDVVNGEKISYGHPFFWGPFILMGRNK